MSQTDISTEMSFRIWHNREGVSITVRPDSDIGEYVELATEGTKDKEYFGDIRLVLPPEMAKQVGNALITMALHVTEKEV